MDGIKIIDFPDLGDDRGQLVVAEGGFRMVPFDIKRMFYMFDTTEGTIRGQHANVNSEFLLINVKGSVKIKVENGNEEEIIVLDKPNRGVYLGKMIWKEMFDFSKDSILVVLSSEHYDEKEYVRDYNEFLKIMRK